MLSLNMPKFCCKVKWSGLVKNYPFLIRLFNFEYWPSYSFYLPMLVYYFILALRSRHLCFFTAANPGIKMGGNGLESKYQTTLKIPEKYRPKTVFAAAGAQFDLINQQLKEQPITYPLIAKPDIGFRGLLVKKIYSEAELRAYLDKYPINFILQEFIDLPAEFGVLYYRLPHEPKGRLTSVTLKEFLHVLGDGQSTVLQLVEDKPRAILQLERLHQTHAQVLDKIPALGEKVNLGEIGNHSKGTFFKNGSHLIDDQLTTTIDTISKSIDGIYYGRYDIRCTSFEDLKQGKNIKIIEFNGVSAEPTHIYDPVQSSYFKALRDIARHWSIIYKVAIANHNLGTPYMKPGLMLRELKALSAYSRMLSNIAS